MAYPRKADPVKHCEACGKLLKRKRYNGTLESLNRFNLRKYCGAHCMGAAKMKAEPSLAALRKRAKHLRGSVCAICGATSDLQTHHLDSDPSNNAPSNLMTLCGSCHTRWHWSHGKRPSKRQSVCLHCEQPARKLDMCQKHYQRFKLYGDPFLTKVRHGSQYVLVDERLGLQDQQNSN